VTDSAKLPFAAGVAPWVEGLGRLRNVVRQDVMADQLRDVLAGQESSRVLDIGCGQGTQALILARAGHDVTGLDLSLELLARFETALAAEPPFVRARVQLVHGAGEHAEILTPGPFDLILCHGVLMYLDHLTPLLEALTQVAADQAILSLLVRNGLAPAMRDGLRGRSREALAAFDSCDYVNRLGLPAHAHTPTDLDHVLRALGWVPKRWYGVRVFCDHRDDQTPPAAELIPLLAAEREAGRRDPYRQVAGMLHLTYTLASTADDNTPRHLTVPTQQPQSTSQIPATTHSHSKLGPN
jgi:SAM-dependent methyltransferase